jgi:hypothetical protein
VTFSDLLRSSSPRGSGGGDHGRGAAGIGGNRGGVGSVASAVVVVSWCNTSVILGVMVIIAAF